MSISHPIDGDKVAENAFVQFLGGWHHYTDACLHSNLQDGIDADRGLTAAERLAIWIYSNFTSDWSNQINGELWSGAPSIAVQGLARILSRAIAKLPLSEGRVYRGFESRDLGAFLAKYHHGSIETWPGFTSCSLSFRRACRYSFDVVFLIQPRTGRVLGQYAHDAADQEVVFPAGTRFRVRSVERVDAEWGTIELEEMSES